MPPPLCLPQRARGLPGAGAGVGTGLALEVGALAAVLRGVRRGNAVGAAGVTAAAASWHPRGCRTLPGRLVLGAGFLWSYLVCYTVGVLLGLGLDALLRRRACPAG